MSVRLTLLPSVPVWRADSTLLFDRKFYDGLMFYVEQWPGPLRCVMRVSADEVPPFGLVAKTESQLPFELQVLAPGQRVAYEHLRDSAVVSAAADDFDQLHVSALCSRHDIPCDYMIENVLETRRQIVKLEGGHLLRRWRRAFFLWNGERRRRKALSLANGIQANGMPAYEAYHHFAKCLLYFDTRVSRSHVIDEATLRQRFATLDDRAPLRLAFSGRLIPMKGADHLIDLAKKLRARHLAFELKIYGAGELREPMAEEIARHGLDAQVSLMGVADFHTELVPTIKKEVDIYVLLHRQSDPSCTYVETLSCGIPILGYDNHAFAGLLGKADVGWQVAMDDIDAAADTLLQLDRQRDEIRQKSLNSMNFARLHDFETTFARRIAHLRSLVDGGHLE